MPNNNTIEETLELPYISAFTTRGVFSTPTKSVAETLRACKKFKHTIGFCIDNETFARLQHDCARRGKIVDGRCVKAQGVIPRVLEILWATYGYAYQLPNGEVVNLMIPEVSNFSILKNRDLNKRSGFGTIRRSKYNYLALMGERKMDPNKRVQHHITFTDSMVKMYNFVMHISSQLNILPGSLIGSCVEKYYASYDRGGGITSMEKEYCPLLKGVRFCAQNKIRNSFVGMAVRITECSIDAIKQTFELKHQVNAVRADKHMRKVKLGKQDTRTKSLVFTPGDYALSSLINMAVPVAIRES